MTERIAMGLLLRTFPPELVDLAISSCGRVERRSRLLPARTTVYFILVMCLFPHQGYARVAELLNEGLTRARLVHGPRPVPTTAAISRARIRLGPEPLAALFKEAVRASRTPPMSVNHYRNWKVMTADRTTVALPDSPDNRDHYGLPASRPPALGEPPSTRLDNAALPRIHVMALAEQDTRTIAHAVLERPPSRTAGTLARELCGPLRSGDLLLADEGFLDPAAFAVTRANGADLLWRIHRTSVSHDIAHLRDGSRLCTLHDHPRKVRVIESAPPHQGEVLSPTLLATTVLDHESAPAAELAALSQHRWCLRSSLPTLGPGTPQVLRSRWPDGVEQEIWGHLLVHHAIHQLLYI
jgi:hypothetical protein